ncbi:MAG TPA: ATP-binding cassette domain-containing protein, partial [Planctomycetota bacterium]|nr:ATP-binding cassette domain-containing protein [Planctomycetota bacterium]
ELSGGERQRLALARALAGAPRLLLLDEPLHSVDVHLRDELALLIRSIADERRLGLVVVTHDRRDAFALATEIVVLHAGRVVESGPATRLAQEPQTAFAAAFLAGATCIPLPAAKDGRVVTPFGELAAPRSGDGLVLALLPGDLRIAAPGEGTAVGRVLRVVPDPLGLLATVQVGPHVVQAACGREVVRRGDRVELALNHAPRVLLRDALAHDRSGPR